MEGEAALSRGPLGEGPQVYLGRTNVFRARAFYGVPRPSSTLFEQAKDVLDVPHVATLGRRVWADTDPSARTDAMDAVLAPFPLLDSERSDEKAHATRELEGEGPQLFTTALWTVERLCEATDADSTCAELADFWATRDARIARSVNAEMGQQAGADCSASGPPLTPYSDASYTNLARLYLEAALGAGFFPEVTTHFVLDAPFRGHCDPRCFDVGRLYQAIADAVGHAQGTRYGASPSYGTVYGAAMAWWSEAVCGASSPAP
jgi:hypothetical protein